MMAWERGWLVYGETVLFLSWQEHQDQNKVDVDNQINDSDEHQWRTCWYVRSTYESLD
jgi:hypothetical protein